MRRRCQSEDYQGGGNPSRCEFHDVVLLIKDVFENGSMRSSLHPPPRPCQQQSPNFLPGPVVACAIAAIVGPAEASVTVTTVVIGASVPAAVMSSIAVTGV